LLRTRLRVLVSKMRKPRKRKLLRRTLSLKVPQPQQHLRKMREIKTKRPRKRKRKAIKTTMMMRRLKLQSL